MQQILEFNKGTIQETLLLPLWGRAYETRKNKPRLVDRRAQEIIEKTNYDFSNIEKTQALSQHSWVARSLHTDKVTREFIQKHPKATIVNIGCGLDTTFNRIDNGEILFYELDLPEVIALRKEIFTDTSRRRSIASSFLDTEWFAEIEVRDGLLFLAGGVLMYFDEEQIKAFFIKVADHFKNCEFFFDSLSPLGIKIAKKMVLKKGGMGMSMEGGWGLKPIKSLEKWDERIKVIDVIPMHRGIKKGLPIKMQFMLSIPDTLGISSMVHLRMGKSG
ncbi:MAG: class I SAM-dependent methyltransferase [Bacteroidota bacterium]